VTDGRSALLVPPSDSAALAKAMTQLLSDRSTATEFANTAFERARLNFSTAKHDQDILKIYDRLLGNQVE
jgi:glycosyltransferase involved in cell wall biosynthesis